MSFFASLFGYILKFLYDIVGNYGLAIILFSILVKKGNTWFCALSIHLLVGGRYLIYNSD